MIKCLCVIIATFLMVSPPFIPIIEGRIHQRDTCDEMGEATIEIHTITGITTIKKLMTKEEIALLQSILDNAQQEFQILMDRDGALTREILKETTSVILLTLEKLEKIEVLPIFTFDEKDFIFQEGEWVNFSPKCSFPEDIVNLCCLILASGIGIPYTPLSILIESIHFQLWSTLYRYPLLDFLMTCLSWVLFACKMRPRVCYPIVVWLAQEMRVYTLGLNGFKARRIVSSFPYSIKIFGISGFLGLSITIVIPDSGNPFCWMAGTAFGVWN